MNFFKRATTSILRRPGKSIILLLLVFILGSVIAGAISVRGAINNTDANLRRQMRPIVSVAFDHQAWEDEMEIDWNDPNVVWTNPPPLTVSHVREIADLSYVDFYDYMMFGWIQSFEFEQYWGDEHSWMEDWEPHGFSLRGTSNTELVQIEQEIFDLVQGRQFNDSELVPGARTAAIVSEQFAELNNLTIGSTLELYNIIRRPNEDEMMGGIWGPELFAEENIYTKVTMEFEIIGIVEMPEDPDSDQPWTRRENLNTLYIPNWAIEDLDERTSAAFQSSWEEVDFENPWTMPEVDVGEDEEHETSVTPLFVLDDPADIDNFRTAAEDILPDFYTIEDLSSTFDDIASSMETMQGIANWILWVSIVATLLILSLLITLFLRDRRYEMGVYLALGEKKGKIVSQILMEVVVTSFVAITLAVFTGNIISGVMSRNMLRDALVEQANQDDDPWGWSGQWSIFDQFGIPTTNMSTDEMMDAFQISLSVETVGLFYIVGLGAVVLSTMAPVLYVVTLNPKKVLM